MLDAGVPPNDVGPGRRSMLEERGCESGCSDPARQLNWPVTPGGKVGGRGGERGAETTPARCDPSTPRWGEGWCWAEPRSILPWPPGRGWGRSEGESDRSPQMLNGYSSQDLNLLSKSKESLKSDKPEAVPILKGEAYDVFKWYQAETALILNQVCGKKFTRRQLSEIGVDQVHL